MQLTKRSRIALWGLMPLLLCARAQENRAQENRAQENRTQKQPRLTFEVASIRASDPGLRNGFIKAMPGGEQYTAVNVSVKLMISLMWKVPNRQIEGAPGWLNSEHFDVTAKADGPHTIDDLHTMYQNLLIDRLGLKFHMETREGNIYALTVDKAGLKMKPNLTPQDFNIPVNYGPEGVIGKRVPMNYLAWFLGQALQNDERPVVDETGLKGNYDWTLSFAPVLPPGAVANAEASDRPSLFDAVRDQLGLKLQAQRGPVQYFVIDHVEKPSPN
jgi:uncharacterized protein (TIGR03435 family)